MGWFSFARDERFLLAGLGAVVVSTVISMRFLLVQYRDASEIKPVQPKTQYITQETEDSLKLRTLETLLSHYNFAIRETAAKIVCDRAANHESTFHILLYGITRPNYEERMKNLRAMTMITDTCNRPQLGDRKPCLAFVRSLELCADEAEYPKLDDKDWDSYPLRDPLEKMLLVMVLQSIHSWDATELVKAKLIEKWLVRQNWGDSDEERMKNFQQYNESHSNRVTDICRRLHELPSGRETLERVKLLPPGSGPPAGNDHLIGDALIIAINDTGEDQGGDMPAESFQPRLLEQSAEEQRLRRQHREAMVLNDGTRPFGREDIIEREHD